MTTFSDLGVPGALIDAPASRANDGRLADLAAWDPGSVA
jgi:hypothetical protein